jgi:hypothetical protein
LKKTILKDKEKRMSLEEILANEWMINLINKNELIKKMKFPSNLKK